MNIYHLFHACRQGNGLKGKKPVFQNDPNPISVCIHDQLQLHGWHR